jgi:hypothetical protein
MKRALLAAAAVLTFGFAGQAMAQENGYVGATYTNFDVNSTSLNLYGVDAVGSFKLTPNYELQLDGRYMHLEGGGITEDFSSPTVHLFRATESYKAGVFAGGTINSNVDFVAGGLEGRYFVNDNISLGATLAYGQLLPKGFGSKIDAKGLNLDGSYFISDTFRLDASVSLAQLDVGTNINANTYAIGGEYQFPSKSWSATLDYSHTDINDFGVKLDAISAGFRWTFGGSLKDRDRHSSPFGGANTAFGGNVIQSVITAETQDSNSCQTRVSNNCND